MTTLKVFNVSREVKVIEEGWRSSSSSFILNKVNYLLSLSERLTALCVKLYLPSVESVLRALSKVCPAGKVLCPGVNISLLKNAISLP